ncbi:MULTISPECIES: hypothetical protein [Ramlibacter]|uniref:Cysteine dioxygenase n=1 Tax=Ramlibacter pinisoli TaxID=2682844 RepID=A0A6N8ISX3_9BURK|nr:MULTISPECIES: hypothetical protein [Ramlibacter]MBA2964334.1 hypothetical protein [Ramlibacter sp. CGMCC 1.13660]MVQ29300.1 hypothetical protein [Ramlibacter pinisoli]
MTMTLDALARECRSLLQADGSPAGRAQVAALLGRALRDREFVRAQFAGGMPERKILHEDRELGFCILGHEYHDAREGGPHDHGPSWAIYGQAEGETTMTDFVVVQPAGGGMAGKVRRGRSYALRPGDAHLYNEGAVHAPSRSGPTRLIRIEGRDLAKVARGTYEVVAD